MKIGEIYNKLLQENTISFRKVHKDILDDITDEKIGGKEYIEYEYIDDLGGRAIGTIDNEVASITQMNSQPTNKINTDELKRRGFFTNLINTLKNHEVRSITIKLQSNDTRKAITRLIEKGVLKNPRNNTGVSIDQHPTLFDL